MIVLSENPELENYSSLSVFAAIFFICTTGAKISASFECVCVFPFKNWLFKDSMFYSEFQFQCLFSWSGLKTLGAKDKKKQQDRVPCSTQLIDSSICDVLYWCYTLDIQGFLPSASLLVFQCVTLRSKTIKLHLMEPKPPHLFLADEPKSKLVTTSWMNSLVMAQNCLCGASHICVTASLTNASRRLKPNGKIKGKRWKNSTKFSLVFCFFLTTSWKRRHLGHGLIEQVVKHFA